MILTSAVLAALTFAANVATAADPPPPKSGPPPIPAPPSKAMAPTVAKSDDIGGNLVARGKRLVDSHDCHACHTPWKMGPKGPEPDMSLALSGHPQNLVMPPPPKLDGTWGWLGSSSNTAFAGPWGISYAINLTPDPETGMGKWQEREFVQAIKTGKHLGVGRPIMPPMPWPAYRNLSETELRAIYAYLKTVPPIKNRAPDYAPPAAPK